MVVPPAHYKLQDSLLQGDGHGLGKLVDLGGGGQGGLRPKPSYR